MSIFIGRHHYYYYYYLTYVVFSRFMHPSSFRLTNKQNTIKDKCYIIQVLEFLSMQVVREYSLLVVKIS
jgi:hypothetical protein